MFITHLDIRNESSEVWFIYNGCSNHMSGVGPLYTKIEKSRKFEVRLGNDKIIKLEGMGKVEFRMKSKGIKCIRNIQYVPGLSHNLLSIFHLLNVWYSVILNNGLCPLMIGNLGMRLLE